VTFSRNVPIGGGHIIPSHTYVHTARTIEQNGTVTAASLHACPTHSLHVNCQYIYTPPPCHVQRCQPASPPGGLPIQQQRAGQPAAIACTHCQVVTVCAACHHAAAPTPKRQHHQPNNSDSSSTCAPGSSQTMTNPQQTPVTSLLPPTALHLAPDRVSQAARAAFTACLPSAAPVRLTHANSTTVMVASNTLCY
jgi:hypothetical protein